MPKQKEEEGNGDPQVVPPLTRTKASAKVISECETSSNLFDDAVVKKLTDLITSKVLETLQNHEKKSAVRLNNIEKSMEGLRTDFVTVRSDIDSLKSNYTDTILNIEKMRADGTITSDECLNSKFSALEAHVTETLATLEAREAKHQKLTQHVLFNMSMMEQRNRLWSVRIAGFQQPWKNGTPTDADCYKAIIQPTLDKAISNGFIDSFDTSMDKNIEFSHPLPRKNGPPLYVYRFFSRRQLYV